MKAWAGFFVLLIFVTGLIALSPRLAFEPGPISKGHLKQKDDCASCHVPFLGATDNKCTACHNSKEFKSSPKLAFHNKIQPGNCIACHKGHSGGQPRSFEHKLLPQVLAANCIACHAKPKDRLHRKLSEGCASCHGLDAFKPAQFDHDQYFRFDRHHPDTCSDCHREEDYSSYSCYGCHEHSPSNIRSEHLEEGIRQFEDCAGCHPSGDEDQARSRPRIRSGKGQLDSKPRMDRSYRPFRQGREKHKDDHDDHDDHDDD